MAVIIRQAIRIATQLESASAKLVQPQSRCLSNAVQPKVVKGTNGEKIIPSPFGQVTYPEIPLSDYVWEKLSNYSGMTAVVCTIDL